MKRAGVKTAMLVVLWGVGVVWSPARAVGQCCGDCNGDGTVTVNEIVSSVNRALTQCSDDGICTMESCPAKLAQCQTDLASCRAQPGGQRFPASGQTMSYGPGSDGDVRAGAALSYTDNGDGTVSDNNTGLMWEKKDDSGGIHGQGNTYTWGMTDAPYTMNGTMVTTFLSTLSTPPCFACHCDPEREGAAEHRGLRRDPVLRAHGERRLPQRGGVYGMHGRQAGELQLHGFHVLLVVYYQPERLGWRVVRLLRRRRRAQRRH